MTDAQRGHHWTGAVCLVLASSTGGVGQHVTSLVRGLIAAGATVTVGGPAATETQFHFTAAGARFVPVEIPPNPTINDRRAISALRAALAGDVDVVHAHGLRAGLVAVLAQPRQPLVVTWHNAVLARRLRGYASRFAERVVARNADVCLGASDDLVERARSLGARDARLAPVAAPELPEPRRGRAAVRAEFGLRPRPGAGALGRPPAPAEALRRAGRGRRDLARDPARPRRAGRRLRARLPAAGGPDLGHPRPGHPARAPQRRTRPAGRRPTSPWSPATGRPASCSPRRRCGPACRWSPPPSAGCPTWSATRRCWSRRVTSRPCRTRRPRSAADPA